MHHVFKKLLTYFSKENRSIVFTLFFLLVFSIGTYAFATYPGTPFLPGDTLDPGCAPGDTNCYVEFHGELNNLTSSADPTVGDDVADGYSVGSFWYNQTSGTLFVASDVSAGAAQWETAGGGGAGNVETINSSSVADQVIDISSTTSITTLAVDSTTTDGTHTIKIPLIDGSNYGSVSSGLISGTDWNTFNSKLTSSLIDGKIFVGDGTNVAAAVTPSGDLSLANTGAFTIANNAITSAKINNGAVANEDLTNSSITINGSAISLGGSATISAAPSGSAGGDLTGTYPNPTIAVGAVTSTKILDGTIAADDLANSAVTTAKILDGNVTNTKLANSSITINGTSVALGASYTLNAVTLVGTLDGGGAASDDGLIIDTISGVTRIYAQTASATKPGLVTTANQTWAGDKTFNGAITASGGLSAGSNRITAVATPTDANDATNKSYVDGLVTGLRWKESVDAATVAGVGLPAHTYFDGPDGGDPGVDAYIEGNSTGALPTIDGVTLLVNDRLLVKDETGLSAPYNGIYIVTTLGDVSTKFKLTRCPFCDQPSELPNAAVAVLAGTVNGGTAWTQTQTITTVGGVGEDIEWVQFLSNAYTGSNGISVSGSTISLDLSSITTGSLSAARGGTGQTSYATGDILYASGSSTLSKRSIGANGTCLVSNGTVPTWGSCSGAGITFSDLSAAGADNDIDNLAYKQVWRWNTLDGGTGLTLSANTDAAASNTQTLLKVALSGANVTNSQTTYGADISNVHTGGGTTANVGLKVSASAGAVNTGITVAASGGSSNYALLATAGNVGIGVTTPSALFSVGSGSTSALTVNSSGNLSTSGTLATTNTTDASNTSTGSVVISGGVGIAKALYVGTTADIATSLTTPIVIGSSSANGTLTIEGNSATGNTATNANLVFKVGDSAGTTAMTILNNGKIGVGVTTPSELFSVGTGSALTINASGNLSTSGTLVTTNTTDASSISTGSIVTDGGVGIEKALYVGTTANVAGLLTASAGATITGTTSINGSGTDNTTIGNSSGGTITIGASSGSNLVLQDAQWSVTGAGAASFASLALTSQLTVANGGTGATSFNAYGILFGGTTGTGAVQSLANTSTAGQCLVSGGTSTLPSWGTCPGGSAPLSSLTAASGTNTINNANYAQVWGWNSLNSETGLKLSTTSTAAAGGTTGATSSAIASLQTLLALELTGNHASVSAQTTYGMQILNSHGNTSVATNVGIKVAATGGANNYALVVPADGGRVGLGTTAPAAALDILGSSGVAIITATGVAAGQGNTGGGYSFTAAAGGVGGGVQPGGAGGAIQLTGGAGGVNTIASLLGGAGGAIKIYGGNAGQITSGTNNKGGIGGKVEILAGAGSSNTNTSSGAGGSIGGMVTIFGGTGGTAFTATPQSGKGGFVYIRGGTGGGRNSDSPSGTIGLDTDGGDVVIQGGTKGSGGLGSNFQGSLILQPYIQYSTGTASQLAGTVTGSGTTFTSAMVGSVLIYADGTIGGKITAVGSATSLTVSAHQTVASQAYTINYVGLYIDPAGNTGLGNTTPGTLLHVGSSATTSGNILTVQDSDGTCTLNPASGASVVCSSDMTLKHDIVNLEQGLAIINQLRPTTFTMNVNNTVRTGFIAQEVQTILPDLVSLLPDGHLGVGEGGMMPYVVKAIQEIDVKVELLSSLDIEEENSLASLVRTYLEDAMNGLRKIFVGEVHTDKLCVGTTCVTEAQLQYLLEHSGAGTTGTSGGSGSTTGSTGTDGSGTTTGGDTGTTDGSGTTTGTDGSGTTGTDSGTTESGTTDGSGTTSGETGSTGTDGSGTTTGGDTGTTDGSGTTTDGSGTTTDGSGTTTGTDGSGTTSGSSTTGTDGGTTGSGTTDGSGTGGEGGTGV